MAFTPTFSFAGFQATNPDRPLPASHIDNNFDLIAAELTDLLARIEEIRRDDGRLKNGTATWDAFSQDVKDTIQRYQNPSWLYDIDENLQFPEIVAPDVNPNSFAAQVEAETGVANDRLMTPLRTKQAVDAQRPFASQSQAQAGTDTTVVMSPARAADHIEAKRPFASTSQAQAGADTASVLSPARGKDLVDAIRPKASATVTLTWGAIAAGGEATHTFTIAGAKTGNAVVIGFPTAGPPAGLVPVAWVSAPDTAHLRFTNPTGASITPYSGAATSFTFTALGF